MKQTIVETGVIADMNTSIWCVRKYLIQIEIA